MNVFTALKMLQINHTMLNQTNVVITDAQGKPNALLSELLADALAKVLIFGDLATATTPTGLVDQLRMFTPLREEVLDEYEKILGEKIIGINFATKKQVVELICASR